MSEEKKENQLALREQESLESWAKENKSPLPLTVSLKLYELYLNGYSCEEIFRINGGRIPFGQIVDAKVRHEWDKRKETQLQSLYSNIEQRILKTKNDAIIHITDTLAVAHKVWGDKLKLFLQEGDPSVLGGLDVTNMKTYKELLQMLQVLTTSNKGQSGESKKVEVDGTVNHVHTVVNEKKKLSGDEATQLLKLLEDGDVVDA